MRNRKQATIEVSFWFTKLAASVLAAIFVDRIYQMQGSPEGDGGKVPPQMTQGGYPLNFFGNLFSCFFK
jgi:hypothetical protein